jgi:hypothetical protein
MFRLRLFNEEFLPYTSANVSHTYESEAYKSFANLRGVALN